MNSTFGHKSVNIQEYTSECSVKKGENHLGPRAVAKVDCPRAVLVVALVHNELPPLVNKSLNNQEHISEYSVINNENQLGLRSVAKADYP
jgi:hypothetical protein